MNTVTPFKLHSSEQLNEAKMLSDLELVERIVVGDLALYELIMRSRRADWSQPHLTVGNSNPEEPMQLPTSKKYTPEEAAWNGL